MRVSREVGWQSSAPSRAFAIGVEFSDEFRHRVRATQRPRMSTQHVRSHAWHPMSTPVRYCYAGGFALGAGLGLFFARAGDGGWPLFFIGGLFAFASFGMAT